MATKKNSQTRWYHPVQPNKPPALRPHALAICRRWWRIVTLTPAFWTNILIHIERGAKITEGTLKWVAMYLHRSQSAPLEIALIYISTSTANHTEEPRMAELAALVLPLAFRYKSFKYYISSSDANRFFPLLAPLASLRELAVSTPSTIHPTNVISLIGEESNCIPIALDVVSARGVSLAHIDATKLDNATISFGGNRLVADEALNFLAQCKNLQVFTIVPHRTSLSSIHFTHTHHVSPIYLDPLVSLDIFHPQLNKFLSPLVAPHLQHLAFRYIGPEGEHAATYNSITSAKFPALRTLSAQLYNMTQWANIHVIPTLISFSAHPDLESLEIDDAVKSYGLSLIRLIANNLANY